MLHTHNKKNDKKKYMTHTQQKKLKKKKNTLHTIKKNKINKIYYTKY